MGLIDTLRTWLTPLPAMEERDFWPFMNFNGQTYPLSGLNQTLHGTTEEIKGNFLGMTQAYEGNGILFTCLNARMSLFTQASFMYRQRRSGTPGELFSTADLEILRAPWPGGTTADLLARLMQYNDLAGNAFAVRRPTRIRVPRPDWMTIVMGSHEDPDVDALDLDADLLGYAYHPGGHYSGRDPIFLDPSEVAHFALIPDPLATYRGISWMGSLLREIEADSATTAHKLAFFRNGATPNLVVTGITPAANQSFEDWSKKFRASHEGAANAYRTLLFSGAVDAKVVGSDLKQLDFKLTQGAGETRIAAAASVPPVVAGFSEGLSGSSLNSGNFAASMRRFADLFGRPAWRNAAGSLASIVRVPAAAELWYDDRDIPALKDDIKDAAEVQSLQAAAIRQYVDAGFDPQSVVDAINAGDLKRLAHTGLYSVQLQRPMPDGPPPPVQPRDMMLELSERRTMAAERRADAPPIYNFNAAPVSVTTPDITLPPPTVTFERGAVEVSAPVTVEPALVTVTTPAVTVEPTMVTITNTVEPTPVEVTVEPTPVTVMNTVEPTPVEVRNEVTVEPTPVTVMNEIAAPNVHVRAELPADMTMRITEMPHQTTEITAVPSQRRRVTGRDEDGRITEVTEEPE